MKHSLEHVDREKLYTAVRASLKNEDGWARGQVATLYKRLSFEEIEPLLPAIYEAVVEAAPSGKMFADQVRLAGLDVLAEHRIEEGISECVNLIDRGRWGSGKRIPKCLKTLQRYGTAAQKVGPELKAIKREIKSKKQLSDNEKKQIQLLDETLRIIEGNSAPPKLRSLSN